MRYWTLRYWVEILKVKILVWDNGGGGNIGLRLVVEVLKVNIFH